MAELRTINAVEKLIMSLDRAEAEALIYLLRVADAHSEDLTKFLHPDAAKYVVTFGSSMETAIELSMKS